MYVSAKTPPPPHTPHSGGKIQGGCVMYLVKIKITKMVARNFNFPPNSKYGAKLKP